MQLPVKTALRGAHLARPLLYHWTLMQHPQSHEARHQKPQACPDDEMSSPRLARSDFAGCPSPVSCSRDRRDNSLSRTLVWSLTPTFCSAKHSQFWAGRFHVQLSLRNTFTPSTTLFVIHNSLSSRFKYLRLAPFRCTFMKHVGS